MSHTIYARSLSNGTQIHVDMGDATMTLGLVSKDAQESDMPELPKDVTSADLSALGFVESVDAQLNTAVRSMLASFGYVEEEVTDA